MKSLKFYIIIISGLVFNSVPALGQSLSLLPQGVWSPMFKSGIRSNLDNQYGSNGSLGSLKSDTSVELNAEKLVQVAPEAQKAVSFLNQVNGNGLGDLLHLGVIELDIKPEVQYSAPVLAYGVTDRLTVALAVPIINYTNDVNISHYGSNINEFAGQFSLTPELDDAFQRMKAVGTEFQNTIVEKGYKPLGNRNEKFIGDLLLTAHYIAWQNASTTVMTQSTLNLPTGPEHDADDLLAVNLFGRTSLDQTVLVGYQFNPSWTVVGKAGVEYTMPDKITARVPANEDDDLPGAETKEVVSREIGVSGTVGIEPRYTLNSEFSFSGGVDYSVSESDYYNGSRGQRYDLLARDTASNSTTVNFGVSYSTVGMFQRKEVKLPAIISYGVSDIVAGQNIRRQQTHELTLTLFYK